MNYLRKIVSGKKNRFQGKGFNLDLTYITPRIIAMSLPGEGVHKLYRNSIDHVSQLLNDNHRSKYRIFNLSGLKYDYSKFADAVEEFKWEDHYPPPIDLLFSACSKMHDWLTQNIEHVVVVNCRAGKGRTGTLIVCYLLYSGRFTKAEEALKYYKIKRFSVGGGVTQPSQIRYVKYFFKILRSKKKSPNLLQLRCIKLKTAPHMSRNSCRPVIEIKLNKAKVFNNKKVNRDSQSIISDDWEEVKTHQIALANSEIWLCGDTNCFLYHWGRLKLKKICRFSFNSAFCEPGSTLELRKIELDPDCFRKNRKVSDFFSIALEFEERKCECDCRMVVEQRCQSCKEVLSKLGEFEKWTFIIDVVSRWQVGDSKVLLFGNQPDTVEEDLQRVDQGSSSLSEGSDD